MFVVEVVQEKTLFVEMGAVISFFFSFLNFVGGDSQRLKEKRLEDDRLLSVLHLMSISDHKMEATSREYLGLVTIRPWDWTTVFRDDPRFPNDVDFSEVSGLVRAFNDQGRTVEKSGSIDNVRSVHHLWKNILLRLRKLSIAGSERDHLRIVYEWTMFF